MKKLKVNLGELAFAMEDASWETSHYLDLETGAVVSVSDEMRRELESIYEETYDPQTAATFDLANILPERDLPDWYQQELLATDQLEREYLTRYIAIPQIDSHEAYRDMEAFIITVRDQALQERLWQAIKGRGAFRRFKDTLARYPRERERWFEYQDKLMQQRVLDWLAAEEIEPIIEPLPTPTSPPPLRPKFIEEVLAFVHAASHLPGVTRIALIGSLATDEPEPKDADLLVTVTAEMDLAPLATLGRKLNGHLQQVGRGGEVFLADPPGNYLGRTCPWKQCGPGIRVSCDALHCGQRLYLHDDLETIRLAADLVVAPPLELWPQVVVRAPLPVDVEEGLVAVLKAE
ncbi:MAG: UPF0158 family protein [Chloroflexota bacterium]